jgi:hypothetical protein
VGAGETEALLAALEGDDPKQGLDAVKRLRGRLEELEARHVDAAIDAGLTWSQVAGALGVSKQAAHKKHAQRIAAARAPEPEATAPFVVRGDARRAVRLAREEARAVGDAELGPRHLLLGLLRGGSGRAAEVLAETGLELEPGREALGPREQDPPAGPVPISAEARSVFEDSLRDAVARGDDHLGAEHLLRVLLRDEAGPGAAFLRGLGVDPAEVVRLLDEG